MAEKIMVVEKIEDIIENEAIVGKLVSNTAGDSVKVKGGQGGKLFNRWGELQIGKAYSFTMGLFKDKYPYVQDFKLVESKFVEQAQKQVEDKSLDTKNRSVCLSYSKDLVIAGKVNLGQIFEWSDKLHNYILGGKDVSDKVSTEETGQLPREEAGQGSGDFDEEWWGKSLKTLNNNAWVVEQLKLLGIIIKKGQHLREVIKALEGSKRALLKNGVELALAYKEKTE